MARPKEFDPDLALDRALELFWRRGYEATSIDDLVTAMGVHRASLYATFGDKRALYLAALRRYHARMLDHCLEQLRQPGSPRAILANFFANWIDGAMADCQRRGCLGTNATVELSPHDELVAAETRSARDRMEQAFRQLLERGHTLGELATRHPPAVGARFLNAAWQGLQVLARGCPGRGALEDIVRVLLDAVA